MNKAFYVGLIGLSLLASQVYAQKVELIGVGKLAGTQKDLSGLADQLSDATPHNTFGGISGLEYLPEKELFLAVSDRGPKDGAVDWHCRFHTLKLDISGSTITPDLKSTVLMHDHKSRPIPGRSIAYAPTPELASRFDPEGIRTLPNGNFLVSDEYGPQLIEFTPLGEEVRRIPVPKKLLVRNLGPDKGVENGNNSSGRSCNRGMEGIAISEDGKYLFGMMQSSLLQDSVRDASGKPQGHNVRLIRIDLATNAYQEFVYVMDNPNHKLHEILPLDNNRFLVLENDGEIGEEANCKRIYQIDLENATDVQSMAQLPWKGLPSTIKPLGKKLFVDMQADQFGLKSQLPEKIEGLTWGPSFDGMKTLVVASDNDFDENIESQFFVFRVDLSQVVTAEPTAQKRVSLK